MPLPTLGQTQPVIHHLRKPIIEGLTPMDIPGEKMTHTGTVIATEDGKVSDTISQ